MIVVKVWIVRTNPKYLDKNKRYIAIKDCINESIKFFPMYDKKGHNLKMSILARKYYDDLKKINTFCYACL